MSDSQSPPVIFLMGPTASGKTGLAVDLVKRLPLEIVSVDSALVYRDMDIGTAKPDAEVLALAPHRLIDFLDPAENYSAAQFASDARREIRDIHGRGNIPLLVGGTMLYYKALLEGLSSLPEADAGLRARIDKEALELGWPALHRRLAGLDPEAAGRIHPNDAQRIQRALEVVELTGKGVSEHEVPEKHFPWSVVQLAVNPPDRAVLHQRIAQRFEEMMRAGFIEEVIALRSRSDLSLQQPSMRCVGYRQLWQHLDGDYGLDEAMQRGMAATRQLAKRQLTWLRSWKDVTWLDATSKSLLEDSLSLLGKMDIA